MSRSDALRWTVLGLTALVVYVCWPLWPALVLAAWTAAISRPLLVRFDRVLKGRRRAAATLALLLFVTLAMPLGLVVLGTVSGVEDLAQTVLAAPTPKGAIEAIAGGSPTLQIPRDMPSAIALARRYGTDGFSVLSKVAGVAATGVVALFIYFGGAFVFLLEGGEAWDWAKRHSPLDPAHMERLAGAFHETGRGLLVGVGLTSATQGLVATIIYASLGVPRWWVLGPITGLASMIPLIGSSLVWGPIALGLLVSGRGGAAAILMLLGVGVISTVDNVLRPIYARLGSLRLPMFLLFVSIFGGLVAFGTWGAILGPLVVRMWLEALAIRRESTTA